MFEHSIINRFWDKVNFTESCWLWEAATTDDGYGSFWVSKKLRPGAHRYSYVFCVGDIPENLMLDHLCRVRNCINPDHLEPVTCKENTLRGIYARKRGS